MFYKYIFCCNALSFGNFQLPVDCKTSTLTEQLENGTQLSQHYMSSYESDIEIFHNII